MSKTVTIADIAEAMDVHRTSALRRAEKECWFSFSSIRKGGGRENLYPIGALPQAIYPKVVSLLAERELAAIEHNDPASLRAIVETAIETGARLPYDLRAALCERELAAQAPALPANTAPTMPLSHLTDNQRRVAEARMAILAEIDRLTAAGSIKTATLKLSELAASGRLSPRLAGLVPVANARSGEGRALSPRTIKRWRALYKSGGFAALAPQEAPRETAAPWWAEGLLRHWARPTKPALTEALAMFTGELAPLGLTPPTYDQARAFIRSLGTLERNRGRMGPRELKTLKPYVKRDDSILEPLDLAQIDGHQFDAEVCHPFHGGPFRPEITTVIDTRTRLALGFSTGLAESAEAVMDAIRDAVLRFGIFAILYTDNGAGNLAQATSGAAVGLLARLGITHTTSLPYNSQARGRSERSHQTIWVAAARKLPAFMGDGMDAEARKIVHKLTRNDIEGRGRRLLMPWREFTAFCRDEIDAYNNRPHRGLETITDPATGKRRHMTPMEAWRTAIAAGFTPETVDAETAEDLFRPHREATTRRGVITFANLEYFHEALTEFGGERVQVAYEPADPAFVWVKTMEGRLICKAVLDGHKKDFIPLSMRDQARLTRAEGRRRLLKNHLDEVEAELRGPAIEHAPQMLTIEQENHADSVIALLRPDRPREAAPILNDQRPVSFGSDARKVEWMAANPHLVEAADMDWFHSVRDEVGEKIFAMIHGDLVARILQQNGDEMRSAAG